MRSTVPDVRIDPINDAPVHEDRDFVLYWMIAARRTAWNFGLDRAVDWARALGKPLVVLEALRAGYPWASDRLHRFVIEGMRDNQARLARTQAMYYPYVEPEPGAGSGLLAALAARAAVVVTDDFPSFFLPRMVAAAGARLGVRLEAVDGNGIYPLRASDTVWKRAVDFRRHLQKHLAPHLADRPKSRPFAGTSLPRLAGLPRAIARRWPAADLAALLAAGGLDGLAIDHNVVPVGYAGGAKAAAAVLARFIDHRLHRYDDGRRDVVDRSTSELSPYLHFGHVSAHQVLAAVADAEDWHPGLAGDASRGKRIGWWGMSEAAESFLDELVTWRELGHNTSAKLAGHATYAALPAWARQTLEDHLGDARPHVYELAAFESARTHDALWNAAQRELVRDGRIHNYLRMLWGKKIVHWSPTPQDALDVMIELNDKYAVDGRDPNSTSGIFWCLGRYDRAWGPEREVFGKVRFMSSASARRKLDAAAYIAGLGASA